MCSAQQLLIHCLFFSSSPHFSFLSLILFVSHNTIIMQAYVLNAFILNVVCFRFQYKPIHIQFLFNRCFFGVCFELYICVFILCCSSSFNRCARLSVGCCELLCVFGLSALNFNSLVTHSVCMYFLCNIYMCYSDHTKTVSLSRLSALV